MDFKTHPRLGIRANIPPMSNKAQPSVLTDYDCSFGVRAAQLWNTLPAKITILQSLDSFKTGLGKFLEQYPDTPPVPGYTPVNDNSLLSWRKMHTMLKT